VTGPHSPPPLHPSPTEKRVDRISEAGTSDPAPNLDP
jgi:hypothetical protein